MADGRRGTTILLILVGVSTLVFHQFLIFVDVASVTKRLREVMSVGSRAGLRLGCGRLWLPRKLVSGPDDDLEKRVSVMVSLVGRSVAIRPY